MLQEIYINNLILIDEFHLQLDEGLNVFTGETGAGKSIIIDALGLLMGNRVSGDMIRDSSRKAVVEAVFTMVDPHIKLLLKDEGLVDADDELLIIRREISGSGRNLARVNGKAVTLNQLKSLGQYLVDIHLQHDNQLLLHPKMYELFVDGFHPDIPQLLEQVQQTFDLWKSKSQELKKLLEGEQERIREIDFLQFQIQEIEAMGLVEGEDEDLAQRCDRLRNVEKLRAGAEEIYGLAYNSGELRTAYDLVAAALEVAGNLKNDVLFAQIYTTLESCLYTLEDIGGQMNEFKSRLEVDPQELEEIEQRLISINRLKSKYGHSIEKIFQYLEQARQEKAYLETNESRSEELQKEVQELEHRFLQQAALLSAKRREAGKCLQDRVHRELIQLEMPGVRLEVEILPRDVPGRSGMDQVVFLFSANPGEEPRPLAKVASGGEVSRLVLALKKALAETYRMPTLIFDEIDVGVGGRALNAMARQLYELSLHHQVILVTHSPQVASFADEHYLLEKVVQSGNTTTKALKLGEEEKVQEIARMLSGANQSHLSRQHAREIFDSATVLKDQIRSHGIEKPING